MKPIIRGRGLKFRLSLAITATIMAIGTLISATYLSWEWGERKEDTRKHVTWLATNAAVLARPVVEAGETEALYNIARSIVDTEMGYYAGSGVESMQYVEVLDESGTVLVKAEAGMSADDRAVMMSRREGAVASTVPETWYREPGESCGLYGATYPMYSVGSRLGTVSIGICDTPARNEMAGYIWQSAGLVLLAGIAGLFMAAGISGWISEPVSRLVEGVGNITLGNLDHTVDVTGPKEMKLLAGSFNSMAATLKEKIERIETARQEAEDLSVRLVEALADSDRAAMKLREANEWMGEMADRMDEANRQLAAEKVQTETIVHSMKDGLVALDPEERIILMNPEAEDIFEVKADEVKGHNVKVLIDSIVDRVDEPEAFLKKFMAATSSRDAESMFNITLNKPYRRVLRRRSSAIWDAAGNVAGRVVVLTDITREKELDDMKTNFVSIVSHELRTPLTSIKGALSLLSEGSISDPDARAEFVGIAEQNTDRLISLISNLLDLSKMESGMLKLNMEKLDMSALIRAQVRSAQMLTRQKRLIIDERLSEEARNIFGDREKMEQVVTNLLGNAVKFSPADGRVVVATEVVDDEFIMYVQDEGAGIPKDKLEKVFGKFYQVDMSATRTAGGTGLGLSICRAIVKEHGGRIWAESPVNDKGGARIIVSIPRLDIAPELSARPTHGVLAKSSYARTGDDSRDTVLLVDADDLVLESQTARFVNEGYRVLCAKSGREALRLARELSPGFIFMEVYLPDISGIDVAGILKNDAATRDIPIVFSTGSGSDVPAQVSELGDGFIVKPYNDHELVLTVKQYYG